MDRAVKEKSTVRQFVLADSVKQGLPPIKPSPLPSPFFNPPMLFTHPLRQGDELQNTAEGPAKEVAVQRCNDYNLASIRSSFGEFNHCVGRMGVDGDQG